MSIQVVIAPVRSRTPIVGSSGSETAARERDALGVLEQVGEHSRDQVFLGLRRMTRDPQRQRLVDAAIVSASSMSKL